MKAKDFYISEKSNMLKRADSDTIEAVYRVISKMSKGGYDNGFKSSNY